MSSEVTVPSTAVARQRVLVAGLIVVTGLVLASEFSPTEDGSRFWDDVHWTVAYAVASTIAWLGTTEARGSTRVARGWFTAGLLAMTLGQIVWAVQELFAFLPFPGPSDIPFTLVGTCFYIGLASQIGDLPRAERGAYVLDGVGITLGVLALILGVYIPLLGSFGIFAAVVLVSYPVLHLGAAGAALVVILARRTRMRREHVFFVASLLALGIAWMFWNWWFLENALRPGVFLDYAFSYCAIAFGVAASRWDVSGGPADELDRTYYLVGSSVPLALVLVGTFALVFGQRLGPVTYVAIRICFVLVVLVAAVRQSLLLRERDRVLAAERKMNDTEERFRQLAESIDDVFVITDPAGGAPLYVGPAFERVWGRSVRDAVGGTFTLGETVHPDDRALFEESTRDVAGTSVVEYRIVRPDGAIRTIRDRRTRIGRADDARIAGLLEDVTEARQASARAAELQVRLAKSQRLQSIGTLAGGIAHDFNNILAAVLMNAEIASQSAAQTGSQRAAIDGILAASERARQLVKRMLAFASYDEAGVSPVALASLAKEVVALLRPVVPSSIELTIDAEHPVPPVLIDATQLHQVLVNLVTNANHAIGVRPGRITITVGERWLRQNEVTGLGSGRFVVTSVRDDGSGMDEATRARIFDPFFTTKGKGEGSGLGLSVVHGIVASHRGAIEVESTLGVGTCFHLFLPAHDESAAFRDRDVELVPRAPIPVLAVAREVLVVDDDAMVNESMMLLLMSLGVRAHSVRSPDAALEVVRADVNRFALVITDMTMPGATGDLLAESMLAIAPQLPIVLVSGNAVDPRPGLFAAVLTKPCSRAMLAETIARCALPGDDQPHPSIDA